MKVSDLVAKILSNHTNCIFGGQGGSVVHLVDSITKNKKLKFISGQNEQASSIAADSYFRTCGKLGVAIGTSGPGIINLLQGMACSYFDSVPSLYISGAPVTSQIRKNKNIRQIGFQEMEVVNLVKPITKYAVLIKNKYQIEYEFNKAIELAFTARMGPVLIDLPDDIQRQSIQKKKIFYKKKINNKPNVTNINLSKKISETIKLINKAKRPLILVGNGIKFSKSQILLKKFINKTNIPYACSWAMIDDFNCSDKMNAGTFGVAATRYGNFAVQNADLLICFGIRLSPQIVGAKKNAFAPNAKKILVEIDKYELVSHQLPKIDIKINHDVNIFLKKILIKMIYFNKVKYEKWIAKINFLKTKYPIVKTQHYLDRRYVNPYAFFNELSKYIKKDTILIPDASANLIWCMQAFKNTKNTKIFTALNHSPMGYSVPASVGAYFANKKKKIISIIGDGSMPMNIQELETIKNFNVNVIIFIVNNSGYGLIKQTQETWLKSNFSGVDKQSGLSLPNNIKIGNAYGIKTVFLKNNQSMIRNLNKILKLKGPVIVDININPKTRVSPKIDSGQPLHEMSPKINKKELDKIMKN